MSKCRSCSGSITVVVDVRSGKTEEVCREDTKQKCSK